MSALIALLMLAPPQAPKPVAIDQEPHHSLLLQNSAVRVYNLDLGVRESTAQFQSDHNYIVISLDDTAFSAAAADTSPFVFHRNTGDLDFYFAGRRRTYINTELNRPYRHLSVEFLSKDVTIYGYQPSRIIMDGPQSAPPPTQWDTDYARTLDLQTAAARTIQRLPGHALDPRPGAHDELLVALSDLDLELSVANREPLSLRKSKGDLQWLPNGAAARIVNRSKDAALFVLISFR